jgi:hypothetical protein
MAKLLSSSNSNSNTSGSQIRRQQQHRRVQVTNFQAFLYTLPLVVIELFILSLFSILDPPRQKELLGVGDGIGVQQITCTHETSVFFITQMIFDGKFVWNMHEHFLSHFTKYSS